jgi:flagellar biosynthesis protein FlhF
MQIRKYQGRSIGEATAKVKEDLGPDAMILSTKKQTGMESEACVEIAALASGYDSTSEEYSELKTDLMSIKDMIFQMNTSGGIMEKLLSNPQALNIYAKIIKSGVSDHCARTILERAGALAGDGPEKMNISLRVAKEISKIIQIDNLPVQSNGKQKIWALVGTTGVGKTTTIAKLAARFMLKEQKKVGLISIDNYRIGAMEQLKTYANILGVPCYPAFNRKDLLFVLKKLGDKDVILIDTAGQSQYDSSRIAELQKMMMDNLEIESHLLLSVSTSEKEMHQTVVNFEPLNCKRYIFTKIDEAQSHGVIINQLMKLNLPISYVTNGQNVPEDIEQASKEKIAKLVLDNK